MNDSECLCTSMERDRKEGIIRDELLDNYKNNFFPNSETSIGVAY